jgi:hypothetical protein
MKKETQKKSPERVGVMQKDEKPQRNTDIE